MFTSLFWKDLAERVIATVAQVVLGIMAVDGFDLASLDWHATLTLIGVTALGVVAKALVATQVRPTISPASLAKDERGI